MMKIINRKSVSDKLSRFDYLKNKDASDDFIEVTEWSNGEGIDISIESRPLISLSFGELSAINYLTKSLEYHDE